MMDPASRAPNSDTVIRELRAPHKNTLLLVAGIALIVAAGLPGLAGMLFGVVLLATGGEGVAEALMLGVLMAGLGLAFPAYFYWLSQKRATQLERMLGPDANLVASLHICEVRQRGILVRHQVVATMQDGSRRIVDCRNLEWAEAILAELSQAAPQAQVG